MINISFLLGAHLFQNVALWKRVKPPVSRLYRSGRLGLGNHSIVHLRPLFATQNSYKIDHHYVSMLWSGKNWEKKHLLNSCVSRIVVLVHAQDHTFLCERSVPPGVWDHSMVCIRSYSPVYVVFVRMKSSPIAREFKIQETKNIAQQGKYSIYTQIWKTLFETWWQPPQVGLLYNSAPRHGLVMVGISDVCIGHITNPELLQSHSLWSAYPPTGWRQWLWSQTDCGAAAGKRSKLHRWGSISREVAQKKQFWGVLFRDGQNWYRSASIFGNLGNLRFEFWDVTDRWTLKWSLLALANPARRGHLAT